jgi:hypothetical protein
VLGGKPRNFVRTKLRPLGSKQQFASGNLLPAQLPLAIARPGSQAAAAQGGLVAKLRMQICA